MIRREFEKVAAWAKSRGVKTGNWFFRDLGGSSVEDRRRRWEVGVELKSRRSVRGEKGVSMKVFPGTSVVSVTFDPGKVSPEIVYHGIWGWLWWRKKFGKYAKNGPFREVYLGNPWTSKRAWARTQVQCPLRKP